VDENAVLTHKLHAARCDAKENLDRQTIIYNQKVMELEMLKRAEKESE
jgi:hypothetical protein